MTNRESSRETSIGLVVPVLNAARYLDAFLGSLERQTIRPTTFLAIDSSSTDDTVERLRAFGAEVVVIPRAEFDHGGTRQRALMHLPELDLVVFATQDVIFADEFALERLVAGFSDPLVGAVYGRQIAHKNARAIEMHSREFNYPAEGHVRSQADIAVYGFRSTFLSNAFSAYRPSALMAVGGFPRRSIFGEDSYVTAKLILAGWRIAYQADARVHHSHDYTIAEEFRRYFDIGVFHSREPWIRESFGGASGEGMHFVRSELSFLSRTAPGLIPSALARTCAKYAAYRMGRMEARLPTSLKRRLSMSRGFWNSSPSVPVGSSAPAEATLRS
ncbi:MAG TPA: glycosyltransferase family 2 protein [Gemmatimonadaceae bacterium]|nr:glycosyltransferase family 2 protein [Gemmatimonadaceae bacterium]